MYTFLADWAIEVLISLYNFQNEFNLCHERTQLDNYQKSFIFADFLYKTSMNPILQTSLYAVEGCIYFPVAILQRIGP